MITGLSPVLEACLGQPGRVIRPSPPTSINPLPLSILQSFLFHFTPFKPEGLPVAQMWVRRAITSRSRDSGDNSHRPQSLVSLSENSSDMKPSALVDFLDFCWMKARYFCQEAVMNVLTLSLPGLLHVCHNELRKVFSELPENLYSSC